MNIKTFTSVMTAAFLLAACNNADDKKATASSTSVSTSPARENADSSRYMNLEQSGSNYTFSKTPNSIMLGNGMKLELLKIDRMPIPATLKVQVTVADDKEKAADYELADIEIKATNTSSGELKFDGSNIMCAEFELHSKENNYKTYREQATLSAGNVFMSTAPVMTDKFTAESKSFIALYDEPYKAGETKSGNGIVIPVPEAVIRFGYLTVKTRTNGQYQTFACAINL